MTSSPHGPYVQGYTRATMVGTKGSDLAREANPKSLSQSGLESATRLHEVGIASNRGSACRGEYVPGPCTHRPSHHGVDYTRRRWANPSGRQAPKVWLITGVKS
jgi:hypothetical protein